MREKWKQNRGETLVEVLASIVIASLSVALLFGGIMASSTIERSAQTADRSFYEALSNAEGRGGTGEEVEITVSRSGGGSAKPKVWRYGGKGVYAYYKDGGTGP